MINKTPEQLAEEWAIENWLYQEGAQPTDIARDSFDAGYKAAMEEERWRKYPEEKPNVDETVILYSRFNHDCSIGWLNKLIEGPECFVNESGQIAEVSDWKPIRGLPAQEDNEDNTTR